MHNLTMLPDRAAMLAHVLPPKKGNATTLIFSRNRLRQEETWRLATEIETEDRLVLPAQRRITWQNGRALFFNGDVHVASGIHAAVVCIDGLAEFSHDEISYLLALNRSTSGSTQAFAVL
jgi:hypothetical protein